MVFIGIITYDKYLHERESSALSNPNSIGSDRDSGYFQVDPKTILTSLENENSNIFTPLSEDEAFDLQQTTDISIDWTQADFLKIASALGQLVWADSMDLKDWSIYSILLEGDCGDSIGFNAAGITYFKTGSYGYMTRLIEIHPYLRWVRWAGERSYPKPILRKWNQVDLAGAKISADDALRLANEDIKVHFQIKDDNCEVFIRSSRFDPKIWNLNILSESPYSISYAIDLETGNIIRNVR